ncbi:MAG TPA: protein jag, partial [Desulfobacteraceae bacterium]|nr:protein jag [Desulfobacteraceae bacterium]
EGKTTEEALQNACKALNVEEDQLEVEVIDPGSSGIFGIVGTKRAKIRVRIKRSLEEEKREMDGLQLAKATLEKILSLMPMDVSVVAERIDNIISLKIHGDRSGILIGKKGRTLDALQFIVNKIVNRNLEAKVRILIDSENYRERRKDSLVQLALRMAERAKKTKRPVSTAPLNSRERRIIHLALKEDNQLNTVSRGEGPLKRVMIIPKK